MRVSQLKWHLEVVVELPPPYYNAPMNAASLINYAE